MIDKQIQRVQINQVIGTQIPKFIAEENPLFTEFLKQYYISMDRQGGSIDLAENIDQYLNFENFKETSYLDGSTKLTNSIEDFNDEIEVTSTEAWPQSYGLLKIGNEIITYTSKDSTKFYGCIRGFSGVESLHKTNQPEYLVFKESAAASHVANDTVYNLSNLFLVEFWKKLKYQFLPGFEERSLSNNVNKGKFLTFARDFYRSKGSDESIKILFKVLYGEPNAEIIKPQDYLIKPSNADWLVTKNLIVQQISGDASKLKGQAIFQDSPQASSYVYDSQIINLEGGGYYQIKLSLESTAGDFSVCPSTKVTDAVDLSSSTITVDSTIGFAEAGELYVNTGIVTYTSKSSTQFFNCTGLTTSVAVYSDIFQNSFVYSYEDGDTTKPVYLRVTAQLDKNVTLAENTKYLAVGDEIKVKTLGEEITSGTYNKKFDPWIHNVAYEVNVQPREFGVESSTSPAVINTKEPHGFKSSDSVTLIDQQSLEQINGEVIQVNAVDSFTFEFSGSLSQSSTYVAKRNIKYASSVSSTYPEITKFVADVQNTYIDKQKENLYVTSTGLPSYSITAGSGVLSRKKYFSVGTGTTDIIDVTNHNFYTGDKVVFNPNGNPISGITTGVYFVSKIDNDRFKLSFSPSRIFINDFISFSEGNGTSNYIVSDASQDNRTLGTQNLLKRIPIATKKKNPEQPLQTGPVGILLNGVEIISNKFSDAVFYGQIESVDVLNSGRNYDVINPPQLIMSDTVGSGATGNVFVSGSFEDIIVTNPGYDYKKAPSIVITGGNGSGATAEAKMRSVLTSIKFDATVGVNTATDIIGFSTYHNFINGEEIVYKTLGNTGLGIGSTGNNNTTGFLVDGSKYYVIANTDSSLSLAERKNDALAGINTINITRAASGTHQLVATTVRKIIDKIVVTHPGEKYRNKKIDILSQAYPPLDYTQVSTAIVGINTLNNYVFAKNHGFESGDIIEYSTTNTPISGLSTTIQYKAIKLDSDRFRLASVGIGSTFSSENYKRNIYANLDDYGIGTHTFKYPNIQVSISGVPNLPNVSGFATDSVSKFSTSQATAVPVVSGNIDGIFVTLGGTNYGSANILNFDRKPTAIVSSGSGAVVAPIIVNGSIDQVYVLNGGSGYVSTPTITVAGVGSYAQLLPEIINGEVVSVTVLNSGVGYTKETTELTVVTKGSGCILSPNIQKWNVDTYKKHEHILTNPNNKDDLIIIEPFNKNNTDNQAVSVTAPRILRYHLGDNINSSLVEVGINTSHSPIIGWAYDGNPIYGPYGSKNPKAIGNITELKSSYALVSKPNRPSFPTGFFVEDYEYSGDGDLDSNNGRFCVTPDFPTGTYAYFATRRNFPYVLNGYRNDVDQFNYDFSKSQQVLDDLQDDILRNTAPYKLTSPNANYYAAPQVKSEREKSEVTSVFSSGISSVRVLLPGDNYKVGEVIEFDNTGSGGRGADASISHIKGKSITAVSYSTTSFDGVEFAYSNERVTGITSIPHKLSDGDIVTIAGISTYAFKSFEGVYRIGVTSITSNLEVGIGSTPATGMITEISLLEKSFDNRIKVNDIIGINSERFLVLDRNRVTGDYKVLRGYDSTLGLAHTANAEVSLDQRYFTYTLTGFTTNSPLTENKTQYFNPQTNVGSGTTVTRAFVGYGLSASYVGVETGQGSYTRINFAYNPFKIGDYVESTIGTGVTITQAAVVSASTTSILLDYDSTSVVGVATTGVVLLRKLYNIDARNIFIPGHGYSNGQKLKYSYVAGAGLTCSEDSSLTPTFTLQNNQIVYAVKVDDDNIGIVTTQAGIGSTTTRLYFTGIATQIGSAHAFTEVRNQINGSVSRSRAQVDTVDNHGLEIGDEVTLDLVANSSQSVVLKYNDYNSKLLVNPVSFGSTQVGVGSTVSTLSLPTHNLSTGDKVLYESSNPITNLENQREYFVIKIDDNNIKLANSYYNSTRLNYVNVSFGSSGSGTHTLSPINPKLEFTRNSTVGFAVSDSSMQNLKLEFYDNQDFTNQNFEQNVTRIGSPGDGNVNTRVDLVINDNIPNVIYYKAIPVGIASITNNALGLTVDTDNYNSGKIIIKNSVYKGTHSVVSIGSSVFYFNVNKKPEATSYSSTGVTTTSYVTSSSSATGGIFNVKVNYPGVGYKSVPGISTVTTTSGSGGVLRAYSDTIGKIKSVSLSLPGYNYPTDRTISAKADTPIVLRIKNNNRVSQVRVVSGGNNYTTPPKLKVIGNDALLLSANVTGNSVTSVDILNNVGGLPEVGPRVIPTYNSNGIRVIDGYSSGTDITLSLKAPTNGFTEFPFNIGDEIYVEGIVGLGSTGFVGDGYNSDDYGYRNFVVTQRVTTTGSETITYSIAGIGTTAGTFDVTNSAGKVIKSTDLATFAIDVEQTEFFSQEKLIVGDNTTNVLNNGWDSTRRILKVSGKGINPEVSDIVTGSLSGSIGEIEEVITNDSNYSTSSSITLNAESTWLSDSGILNNSLQKIQDSDYYQNFSYSIKSTIPKSTWEEPVNSLVHSVGFKNFSDLVLNSKPEDNLKVSIGSSTITTIVSIDNVASMYTKYNFDLGTEETTSQGISKFVNFENSKLTDYSICQTNKVLKIDDISSQFTGIGSFGSIVGVTSFTLSNQGNSLLKKTFNPTSLSVVSAGTSQIFIPGHDFNTGEELIYDPGPGGSYIGIATTSRTITGVSTSRLPRTVFAYKVNNNFIKLSGIKTDATTNEIFFQFVSPTGIGSTVGAGQTHTLATEYNIANTRALITIDGIVQSPLYRLQVSTGLGDVVGAADTTIKLTGITSIATNTLLQIDSEILQAKVVGLGSTNVVSVSRGVFGTPQVSHTVGAAVTVLGGDYSITDGAVFFVAPPYGPVGVSTLQPGISTNSSFSGRIFYRNEYKENFIFDDISNQFDGIKKSFTLESNNQDVTGIITGGNTNYGIVLINNINQQPTIDYTMAQRVSPGIGASITFTGTNIEDLPRGGIINEVTAGFGAAYQPLEQAHAFCSVSAGGTIQSVGIATSGSGYRTAPVISIASTAGGSGATITATISNGVISGLTITDGGSGYSQASPPIITVGIPTAYSNLELIGGSGYGGKVNVQVGSGGTVSQFQITNRGYGYKPNDVLTISGVPTQVGIATSAFTLTLNSVINNKFSGWSFGLLDRLDDFSQYFNGRRKSFSLTKTVITSNPYSIDAAPGTGIDVENNLLIFINDILQQPGRDYEFDGGTQIRFTEAPKSGSKFQILFYKGSDSDVVDVDITETIKVGDYIRLLKTPPYQEQNRRIVEEITKRDQVQTNNYFDVGISTSQEVQRLVNWTKQTSDLVVDGEIISKSRTNYVSNIKPTSRIIKNVITSDSEVYVENAFPFFRQLDNYLQEDNKVMIVDGIDVEAATASATVSSASTVSSVSITSPGYGYTITGVPNVSFASTVPQIREIGKNWDVGIITSTALSYKDIAYKGDIYVAVSDAGYISTSTNLASWSTYNEEPYDFTAVGIGGTAIVVVGHNGTAIRSYTGTQASWFDSPVFYSRTYNNINFSYTLISSFTRQLNAVAYGNDIFVAVGTGGTTVVTEMGSSGIGTAWVVRSTPITSALNGITFGLGGFITVGNAGRILSGSDGYVWNEVPSSGVVTTENLYDVSYENDKFIAVGENGTIIYSTNGSTWTQATTNVTTNLYSVTYTDNVYVVTGENALVLNSIDGINWNIRSAAISTTLNKIIPYSDGVIGVGSTAQFGYSNPEISRGQATATVSAAGTISAITITEGGFGYNPSALTQVLISPPFAKHETLTNVDAVGDFGVVVGVGTSATGVSTSTPMIKFDFDSDDFLNVTKYGFIARSGIATGDYFVIKNSCVGNGVTSLDSTFSVLGVGSTFIDNVYRADQVINDGIAGIVTVYSNVQSIAGIGSTSFTSISEYSWGKLYNFNTRTSPEEFKLSNTGLTGVSTAPIVTRINALKEEFS